MLITNKMLIWKQNFQIIIIMLVFFLYILSLLFFIIINNEWIRYVLLIYYNMNYNLRIYIWINETKFILYKCEIKIQYIYAYILYISKPASLIYYKKERLNIYTVNIIYIYI